MDIAALDDPNATFAQLKERARRALAEPGGALAVIEQWLGRLATNPLVTIPFRSQRAGSGVGIELHDGPFVRITAEVRYPAAARFDTIVAPGRVTYTSFIRAGGGAVSLWRVSASDRATRLGDIPLRDGHLLTLDGRTRAWSIVNAASPIVTLSAAILTSAAPTIRQFAVADGRLLRAATLDAGAARSELLLGILRASGHPRTKTVLAAATRDQAHFLRWSAMCEWLRHDRSDALPRLREMAAGDHSADVRDAAQRTLDRWPRSNVPCPA